MGKSMENYIKITAKKSIERAFDKAIENNKNLEMDLCNIMRNLCTILQKNGFMQHYETMMIMSRKKNCNMIPSDRRDQQHHQD